MTSLKIVLWSFAAIASAKVTQNLLAILKKKHPKSAEVAGEIVEATKGEL